MRKHVQSILGAAFGWGSRPEAQQCNPGNWNGKLPIPYTASLTIEPHGNALMNLPMRFHTVWNAKGYMSPVSQTVHPQHHGIRNDRAGKRRRISISKRLVVSQSVSKDLPVWYRASKTNEITEKLKYSQLFLFISQTARECLAQPDLEHIIFFGPF